MLGAKALLAMDCDVAPSVHQPEDDPIDGRGSPQQCHAVTRVEHGPEPALARAAGRMVITGFELRTETGGAIGSGCPNISHRPGRQRASSQPPDAPSGERSTSLFRYGVDRRISATGHQRTVTRVGRGIAINSTSELDKSTVSHLSVVPGPSGCASRLLARPRAEPARWSSPEVARFPGPVAMGLDAWDQLGVVAEAHDDPSCPPHQPTPRGGHPAATLPSGQKRPRASLWMFPLPQTLRRKLRPPRGRKVAGLSQTAGSPLRQWTVRPKRMNTSTATRTMDHQG